MKPDADNTPDKTPPSKKVVEPLPGQGQTNPAVELIRQKISHLYADEPDAETELAEAEAAGKHRSKHQQFMHELSSSGKPLAEIQTAWHEYYTNLPDHEKHEVWQEFYAETGQLQPDKPAHSQPGSVTEPEEKPPAKQQPEQAPETQKPAVAPRQKTMSQSLPVERRSVSDIKKQLTGKIQSRSRATSKKSHFKSLLFGLSMGAVSVLVLLFGLFNERFIAPFITPSRTVSNTPIITDPSGTATGSEPRIIIPKINVDIPVVFDEPSIAEDAIQEALERGVVHYGTTPEPGETGNGVIFGHSSNNLLNPGRYKFAFVLLQRLEDGDTFMIEHEGKRYVYRVYKKEVVRPDNLSVLGPAERPSTFSLITCDPPGTVQNRLVVTGEQISPDPANNVAADVRPSVAAQNEPEILPSAAPSLWEVITSWFTGKSRTATRYPTGFSTASGSMPDDHQP